LRYGSAAIGGIVNASNNRIPEALPPKGFTAEAQGGLSSGDSGRNGSAVLEAAAGNLVVHADAFQRSAEDYRVPGGRQANTGLESEGYALGGSYTFKDGFFGFAVSTFDSSYFIPGQAAAAEKNHIDLVETKWMSKGEWRLNAMGLEAIRFLFGATDYRHDEVDGLGPAAVIGSTFLNKQYEARVEAQLHPIETGLGGLRGAVGTQWSERRLSAAGEDGLLLPPALTQSLAVFLFEELRLSERLRLEAAVRLETNSVDGTASRFSGSFLPPPDDPMATPLARHFLPISASVGVLYDLPLGIVARLIGQHVERAPDAAELFYKGPHDATQTFEIGAPGLLVEAANTMELGFKRAKGDFRFDVSATTPTSRTSFLSALPGRNAMATSPPAGSAARGRSIKSSTRSGMRPSLAPSCAPSRISAASGEGSGASTGNMISCAPPSGMGPSFPRCRRTGWAAVCTTGTPIGPPASACCMLWRSMSSRPSTRQRLLTIS